MRSAEKQIVANESREVGRQGSVAEVLPARICHPPDIEWESDALGYGAQRRRWFMAGAFSDILQMSDSFDQLHKQTFAGLTRSIVRDKLAIDGVLRGLRVARDLKCDGVFRIRTKIVADQLHCIRRENRVSEFGAPQFHRRGKQARNRDAFANSFGHCVTPPAPPVILA